MSYTSLAQSTADWALSKVGCAYSQARRTQENIFDCSSLVARAYSAQGKRWKYGGSVPTSNKEIYDDDFELLWPATYAQIFAGRERGGRDVLPQHGQLRVHGAVAYGHLAVARVAFEGGRGHLVAIGVTLHDRRAAEGQLGDGVGKCILRRRVVAGVQHDRDPSLPGLRRAHGHEPADGHDLRGRRRLA